jgi:ABC-type transport system involved in cytochrome bd biosynthesis fused ATPase/permease subunit
VLRHVLLTRVAPLAAFTIAGGVMAGVAGDDTVLLGVGLGMLMLGVVVLTSLFFYEVGRSEDRARAAESRESTRPPGTH